MLSERDRLLSDLSSANSQLKVDSERKTNLVIGLRRHLSIAEEKERLRLSYELHDQAGQGLIAAILEMNAIDALIAGPAHERLNVVRKRMEELGKTLHRIAWELRPPAIDELGLKKALASYVADWSEQCGTEVDFHCDDPNIDDVPSEIGTTVYRVVQEGLTNIVKHAQQPSAVSVVIGRVGTTLQVIIEDNGCGFDIGAITAKGGGYQGLGLDGMRERLLLIGGTLEIESTPGTGTAVVRPHCTRCAKVGGVTEKTRIVLADDHPIVLDGLRNLVRAEDDFELVGEAVSGFSALKLIREKRPDVAVLDISMPELNGIVLSRRLAGEMPDIRLLILTLHEDRAYLNQALEAGVRGYVLKRSAVENLVQAIRAVMVGGLVYRSGHRRTCVRRQQGQQEARGEERRLSRPDRPRSRCSEDGGAWFYEQGNCIPARRRREVGRNLQGARTGEGWPQDTRRTGALRIRPRLAGFLIHWLDF